MPTRGDYRTTMMATDNRSPQTLISGSDQISLLIGSVILTKVWILGISFQTVFLLPFFFTWWRVVLRNTPPLYHMGRITHVEIWAIANSCWIESILHHLIAGFLIKLTLYFQ